MGFRCRICDATFRRTISSRDDNHKHIPEAVKSLVPLQRRYFNAFQCLAELLILFSIINIFLKKYVKTRSLNPNDSVADTYFTWLYNKAVLGSAQSVVNCWLWTLSCMRCISRCVFLQSETKLYNGSDKDVSASGNKLTKKESLKVTEQ